MKAEMKKKDERNEQLLKEAAFEKDSQKSTADKQLKEQSMTQKRLQ